MKILSAAEIRQADAYSIENEPIASIDLMERAANACSNWIERHFSPGQVFLFCGKGNNGGDGLAIARQLHEKKWNVNVFIAAEENEGSPDFLSNLQRLRTLKVPYKHINKSNQIPEIPADALVIDALFGSGLNKALSSGFYANIIKSLNREKGFKLSIDIPSGLFCDNNSENGGEVFQAQHCLSFQLPKLSFLLPNSGRYMEGFSVLDIGLNQEFIAKQKGLGFLLTAEMIAVIFKKRKKFSHKGNYGHALLIAGGRGKTGAALLAAKACLRSGVGLLSLQVPKSAYTIVQTALPEAMVNLDEGEYFCENLLELKPYNAIGIGPGLGVNEQTQKLLGRLLKVCKVPLVLDADALNILSIDTTKLHFLPPSSILTPHPGEFRRMVGDWKSDEEMLGKAKHLAHNLGVYIVLKGAHTAICCPDGDLFFNSTGNPGMAKAGSGDVLTGIILGLLAQGYDAKQAACMAVYVHGCAGDKAVELRDEHSVIASDIIDSISLTQH